MRRLAILASLLGACITPSIPIPPPDPAEMDFHVESDTSGASSATFAYPADDNYKNSTYYVWNHDSGGGVFHIANPDGSISGLTLPAALGDQLVISIEGDSQTVSRCVILREGAQDPNTYCSF